MSTDRQRPQIYIKLHGRWAVISPNEGSQACQLESSEKISLKSSSKSGYFKLAAPGSLASVPSHTWSNHHTTCWGFADTECWGQAYLLGVREECALISWGARSQKVCSVTQKPKPGVGIDPASSQSVLSIWVRLLFLLLPKPWVLTCLFSYAVLTTLNSLCFFCSTYPKLFSFQDPSQMFVPLWSLPENWDILVIKNL